MSKPNRKHRNSLTKNNLKTLNKLNPDLSRISKASRTSGGKVSTGSRIQ